MSHPIMQTMDFAGETRQSDSLRHTWTRLATLNEDALQRGGEAVYSMELVESVFWIRRVR
jgi:hypothetical protein